MTAYSYTCEKTQASIASEAANTSILVRKGKNALVLAQVGESHVMT